MLYYIIALYNLNQIIPLVMGRCGRSAFSDSLYSIDTKIPLTLILSHKGERKSFLSLIGRMKGGWDIFVLFCEPVAHVGFLCKNFLFRTFLEIVSRDEWRLTQKSPPVFVSHLAIISKHFFAFT